SSVVLTVALLDNAVPTSVHCHEVVALPWRAWEVHERMSFEFIGEDLAALLGSTRVVNQVELLSDPQAREADRRRGHVRRSYRVQFDDERSEQIEVEGVGFGYFADHRAAVAAALPSYTTGLIGYRDGLRF